VTVRTQPNPRLIPEGYKRFPFPPGWVHPIEGPHSGMHHMTTRKPKPPNPATATSASKVVSLRETAPSIEPEEGWTKATAEGEHLIAGQGDSDRRLVQLSTVFRWAVDRSDAPPSVALEQALALVADIPTGALHLVQKEGWPATLTEGQALPVFGGAGYVDLNAPCVPNEPQSPPYGYGVGALVALMRTVWVTEQKGRISTEPLSFYDSDLPGAHEYLCRFAVSFSVAHSLWGWGRVTAPAVDAVGKPEESAWTPERLWETLTDFEGRGEKAPMQKLSKLSGVPERTIRAKVKPLRDMKKSPFVGLGNRLNRSG
jgi:hypothetical protein